MSGYNKRTGLFELTLTKAFYWWRRTDRAKPRTTAEIAEILRDLGIKVVEVRDSFLICEPRPGAIWEALSAQPANAEQTAYYRCPPEQLGEVSRLLAERAKAR